MEMIVAGQVRANFNDQMDQCVKVRLDPWA